MDRWSQGFRLEGVRRRRLRNTESPTMRDVGAFAVLFFVAVALSADPAVCCWVGPAQSTLAGMSCAGDSSGCAPTMQSVASEQGPSLASRAPRFREEPERFLRAAALAMTSAVWEMKPEHHPAKGL
jgi:hypothetical protein